MVNKHYHVLFILTFFFTFCVQMKVNIKPLIFFELYLHRNKNNIVVTKKKDRLFSTDIQNLYLYL